LLFRELNTAFSNIEHPELCVVSCAALRTVPTIKLAVENSYLAIDDLLPSYENATHQDPWFLVAPYLSSDSLCAAAVVSLKWHQVMTPRLWGNPASHFGVQNDTVYGTQLTSLS
jgi:hypothetical protein